jgi:predicted KAP-like P-loop ATPase
VQLGCNYCRAETKLKTLVVAIDDLDRCLPDTIIETLEAIKLFLFVPRTAFILGADERLVKYAVRRRVPELPGERAEVGRDYLEKLVQFPIRVPPPGRAEIETQNQAPVRQARGDDNTTIRPGT